MALRPDLARALALILPRTSPSPTEPSHPRRTVVFPGGSVVVEVAATEAARRQGLAGRRSLAWGAGMLFFFEDVAPRTFTLKDTHFSLDLIYLDLRAGHVLAVEAAVPAGTAAVAGPPAGAVVEVLAGWSEAHGVAPGQSVAVV